MKFQITLVLAFLSISQACIFAQVKSIDFQKRSRMVYREGDETTGEFKEYEYGVNRLNFKKITLEKKEFNNEVGEALINKKAVIRGKIDFEQDGVLRLINKYQFRSEGIGVRVVRVGRG